MLLRSHNVAVLVCLMLFMLKKMGTLLGYVKRSVFQTTTYYHRNVEEISILLKAEIAI